jgi:uncharacterized protein (DUF488 family)
METEAFQHGVSQLINLGLKTLTAFMCSEKLPAQCHRSLIADYLTLKGVNVVHLIAPGEAHAHQLHTGARLESEKLVYDRQTSRSLPFQ